MSHRVEFDTTGEMLIHCPTTNQDGFFWTVIGFIDEDAGFCPGCGATLDKPHQQLKPQADLVDCDCDFTTDPDDPEDDWHYDRTCLFCGGEWRGLHCPHDGYQNPCPHCGKKPAVIRETDQQAEPGVPRG